MDPSVPPPPYWASTKQDHPVLYNVAVLAVLALLLGLCFRFDAGFALAAFYCQILVVAQSFRGSYLSSLLVSTAATASLDFLFSQPLYSFRMTKPGEVLVLGTFLVSSLAVTYLSRRLQDEVHVTRRQRDGIASLYRAAQGLLGEQATGAFSDDSMQVLVDAFAPVLRSAYFYDAASGEIHGAGESGAVARELLTRSDAPLTPPTGWTVRRIEGNSSEPAFAAFLGLPYPELLAAPLASLAGLAFERARAFRAASHAAAMVESETFRTAILDALAHEFKTPLAVILAASGGVREAGKVAPDQSELLDSIEQEVARLGSLTTRILRLARLDREDIRLHAEPVDAAAVTKTLIQRYQEAFPSRAFTFAGAGIEACEIHADAELLSLAIGQLLDNAVAYGAPDKPIEILAEESGDALSISVANAGSQIPPEERELVFERLHRGSSAHANSSVAGTGLGLYVARKIASAHGGELLLLPSADGDDRCVFRLSIPVKKEQCEQHR